MPLPSPRPNESRQDFISRCVQDPNVRNDAENNEQAVAICHSIFDERSMSINERLLQAIRSRKSNSEFGYGICTADRYVKRLKEEAGLDVCQMHAHRNKESFADALEKASKTLVYANQDMEAEKTLYFKEDGTSLQSQFDLPKNTLMAFQHVLTTPRKDRDGDVLRTEGAQVDPKMLLLWQHVHTLPIGKMVGVVEQNTKRLSIVSAIVDMNQLSHDAAVMIDSDMGRFSHGFRALEFDELKEEEGEITSPGGFDIKKFEIMEASLVSVPSNVDAETEEILLGLVESDKLKSPFLKRIGKRIRERQPTQSSVTYRERMGDYERTIETRNAADFEEVFNKTKEEKDENRSESRGEEGRGKQKEGTTGPSKETQTTSEKRRKPVTRK